MGRAIVPSGASTGAHEAVELRDGDKKRYLGKGVLKAVDAVNTEIFDALPRHGRRGPAPHRPRADRRSTAPRTSAASAPTPSSASRSPSPRPRPKPAALPLYRYVGGANAHVLPVPMMNIINGGAHADNPIDIQEFMIMPVGAATCAEAIRMGAEVFHTLKKRPVGGRPRHQRRRRGRLRAEPEVRRRGARLHHEVDREGRLQARRRRHAGARLRGDRVLQGRQVRHGRRGQDARSRRATPNISPISSPAIPIISIEDGMSEDDWAGWKALTDAVGKKCQLVGDDLFVTNTDAPRRRHREGRRQLDPGQGQPDRLADRDARRRRPGAPLRATPPSCRTAPARPRTRPSPTSRSPPTAGRSRPARCRAPTASPSTTS